MTTPYLYVLLSAAVAVLAQASADLEPPIPGYKVFVPEWDVQLTPGGEHTTLNGTVQEVLDQLHHANPMYSADFGLNLAGPEHPYEHRSRMQKRADFTGAKFDCQNWPQGHVTAGYEGINYLRKVPGKPKNGPGPGNCGRVSCSYNTAIWWCNDSDEAKELDSFSDIADGADKVWYECTDTEFFYYFASGQAWHKDHWNVIVREYLHC